AAALDEAMAITPDTFSMRAAFLNELAGIYHELHRLTGEPAALDRAIATIQAAVPLTPPNGVDAAGVLVMLGDLLLHPYHMANAANDLALAVSANEAAVDRLSTEDAFRPEALVALARVLQEQHRWTHEPAARSKILGGVVDRVYEAVALLRARDR